MEGTHPRVPMGEPGHRQVLGRGDLPLGDRCLVTGGAGFVGSNLVHALVRQGMAVRVFDDLSTGSLVNLEDLVGEAEFVEGDVRDLEAVWAASAGMHDGVPPGGDDLGRTGGPRSRLRPRRERHGHPPCAHRQRVTRGASG